VTFTQLALRQIQFIIIIIIHEFHRDASLEQNFTSYISGANLELRERSESHLPFLSSSFYFLAFFLLSSPTFLFLPSPFPLPCPFLPSFPLKVAPLNQARGSGILSQNQIWCILALKYDI